MTMPVPPCLGVAQLLMCVVFSVWVDYNTGGLNATQVPRRPAASDLPLCHSLLVSTLPSGCLGPGNRPGILRLLHRHLLHDLHRFR